VALRVPGWHKTQVTPELLSIRKVSGALTNSIFFVSCPTVALVPTLLLRIYGPSSSSLISRSHELRMLHILSSRCHFGPRVYGTFTNGRIEEYFESVTLVSSDLRDRKTSQWIASRMAELHSVDISVVEGPLTVSALEGKSWEIGVKKNVKTWMPTAREVLGFHCVSEATRQTLNIDRFYELWMRYFRWVSHVEKVEGASRRVFAHNDTQCGNILRLTSPLRQDAPEHHQVSNSYSGVQRTLPNLWHRLLWLILNTHRLIQLRSTLLITSMSGQLTIIHQRHIFWIQADIRQWKNVKIFIGHILHTRVPLSHALPRFRRCVQK
jgi:choline kinase